MTADAMTESREIEEQAFGGLSPDEMEEALALLMEKKEEAENALSEAKARFQSALEIAWSKGVRGFGGYAMRLDPPNRTCALSDFTEYYPKERDAWEKWMQLNAVKDKVTLSSLTDWAKDEEEYADAVKRILADPRVVKAGAGTAKVVARRAVKKEGGGQ